MSNTRIFETFGDNDQFEITFYKPTDFEDCKNVLYKSFFQNESASIGSEINRPESEEAREDLTRLCEIVGEDGISLVARDRLTNRIVAVSFNKIQILPNQNELSFFEEFKVNKCKSEKSKSLMAFMITVDSKLDIFEHYKIDTLFEIMFLATLPEYERKSIGKRLVQQSIVLAKELKNCQSLHILSEHMKNRIPQCVSLILTSNYSLKIANDLEFTILSETPYTEFKFNGKTFADRIGPKHPKAVLAAQKL